MELDDPRNARDIRGTIGSAFSLRAELGAFVCTARFAIEVPEAGMYPVMGMKTKASPA
jgi:hypothetical protein